VAIIYLLYNIIFTILTPFLFLYTLINDQKLDKSSVFYRAGFIDKSIIDNFSPDRKRIWIHAVSVGEINAIKSFVNGLQEKNPDVELIISTLTATGQEVARKNFSGTTHTIYLPYDFFWAAKRIMKLIQPDLFITIETEIWPNMLREARRAGARVLMINGRISPRSIDSYKKIKAFMARVLANYDKMSMIMEHDAERLKSLGAAEDKVIVNGNSKYDHLAEQVDFTIKEDIYQTYNLTSDKPVFIAGSTRTGEEEIIIDVYKKLLNDYPELILFLVPRHIKRGQNIKKMLEKKGFNTILQTEIDNGEEREDEQIIIVNTIGELFNIYSIATIVFCGASLVPKGGQNILEPAVWGNPVFYGPSMEDFRDAKYLLEDVGAGIKVEDGEELYQKAAAFLADIDKLIKIGKKAREAVLKSRGASDKNAELVLEFLEEGKR